MIVKFCPWYTNNSVINARRWNGPERHVLVSLQIGMSSFRCRSYDDDTLVEFNGGGEEKRVYRVYVYVCTWCVYVCTCVHGVRVYMVYVCTWCMVHMVGGACLASSHYHIYRVLRSGRDRRRSPGGPRRGAEERGELGRVCSPCRREFKSILLSSFLFLFCTSTTCSAFLRLTRCGLPHGVFPPGPRPSRNPLSWLGSPLEQRPPRLPTCCTPTWRCLMRRRSIPFLAQTTRRFFAAQPRCKCKLVARPTLRLFSSNHMRLRVTK